MIFYVKGVHILLQFLTKSCTPLPQKYAVQSFSLPGAQVANINLRGSQGRHVHHVLRLRHAAQLLALLLTRIVFQGVQDLREGGDLVQVLPGHHTGHGGQIRGRTWTWWTASVSTRLVVSSWQVPQWLGGQGGRVEVRGGGGGGLQITGRVDSVGVSEALTANNTQ